MEPDREKAEALYYEGLDQLADGAAVAAVESFRGSLSSDAAFLDAQHGLIRALRETGAIDEAIDVARALTEATPEDALAFTALSILYQHKGMIPEAEAASTRAKLLDWKRQLSEARQQRSIL